MDHPKPFFIFDRDGIDHLWEQPLRDLAASEFEDRCAISKNWQMDHRVSRDREMEDLIKQGNFIAGRGGEEWLSSLRLYHDQYICQPSDSSSDPRSAYLDTWNKSNSIAGVAPSDHLCHVASLRGIVERVLRGGKAADAKAELIDKIGLSLPEKSPGESLKWLNEKLNEFASSLNENPIKVCMATGILLDKLKETSPPWWACFAEVILDKIETGSARGLCEALGLGHFKSPDWLIVWSYPVSIAGPLYRPTVTEAAANPFHFPSPPNLEFGIPMHLSLDLDAELGDGLRCKTLREVLHAPLREPENWCTGKLLPLENFQEEGDSFLQKLKMLRRWHSDKLRLEFQSETQRAWLDRHLLP